MTEVDKTYRRKAKIKPLKPKEEVRKSSAKKSHRKFILRHRTLDILKILRDNSGITKDHSYSIYSLSQLLPTIEQLSDKSITNNKLPDWQYIDRNKICFYQLVLQGIERAESLEETKKSASQIYPYKLQLVPFVFNLSYELQKRLVSSKKSEVSECMDILNKALKKALRRHVQLWFALEMSRKGNTGKPHIQGSLLVSNGELQIVRTVLHKINGTVRKGFKDHAVRFGCDKRHEVAQQNGLLFSDLKWGLYCQKEQGSVKVLFLDQDSDKYLKAFSASRELNKQAEDIYRQLREVQRQEHIKVS